MRSSEAVAVTLAKANKKFRAGNLIFHLLQSVYQGPNFAGTARREGIRLAKAAQVETTKEREINNLNKN